MGGRPATLVYLGDNRGGRQAGKRLRETEQGAQDSRFQYFGPSGCRSERRGDFCAGSAVRRLQAQDHALKFYRPPGVRVDYCSSVAVQVDDIAGAE